MHYLQVGLALAFGLAALSGCRKPADHETYKVTGIVTREGKPVEEFAVGFIPEKGRPAIGKTDATGRFELSTFSPKDGAIAGLHRVVITPISDEPPPLESGMPRSGEMHGKKVPLIPAKYADVNQTPFRATIEPGGRNQFTFDITGQ